jgi:hypothetical protein
MPSISQRPNGRPFREPFLTALKKNKKILKKVLTN